MGDEPGRVILGNRLQEGGGGGAMMKISSIEAQNAVRKEAAQPRPITKLHQVRRD